MTFLALEEAQGLTRDAVLAWLTAEGWVPEERRALAQWWISPQRINDDHKGIWIPHAGCLSGYPLPFLAARYGVSLQSLLRQINPRLRQGTPSPEARRAHSRNGGVWIATRGALGDGGSICFMSFDESRPVIWDGESWHYPESELAEALSEWSFWPCDAAGNKVRWPERDGVML